MTAGQSLQVHKLDLIIPGYGASPSHNGGATVLKSTAIFEAIISSDSITQIINIKRGEKDTPECLLLSMTGDATDILE